MDRRQFLLGTASLPLLSAPLRAQKKPLKIGVMNDLSSVYADFQGFGSKVAADLAVADYAKSLGVPVEVIIADHQNKPDIGSVIARKWFDTEGRRHHGPAKLGGGARSPRGRQREEQGGDRIRRGLGGTDGSAMLEELRALDL